MIGMNQLRLMATQSRVAQPHRVTAVDPAVPSSRSFTL
jgi:hypothetical protein